MSATKAVNWEPIAVLRKLTGHKHLGVHTEMMVDSMMELYEAGVITNKKKALCRDDKRNTSFWCARRLISAHIA